MHVLMSNFQKMDEVTKAIYLAEIFDYISISLNYVTSLVLSLILIVLPLMTIIDVLYLTIPFARNLHATYRENHQNGAGKIVSNILVSKNAIESYDESLKNNVSPYWCYLKRNMKFYLVVTAVVFVLIRGLDLILSIVYMLIRNILKI